MHPLAGDLTKIKDAELETKINDLTRKYFITQNTDLRGQIASMLDTYKLELNKRRQDEYDKMMNSRNVTLDKLIKVN